MSRDNVFTDDLNKFSMLVMKSFLPGTSMDLVDKAGNERLRNILLGNIYGLRMDFEKSTKYLLEALEGDSTPEEAYTCMLLMTTTSISGDVRNFDKALSRLKYMSDYPSGNRDVDIFSELLITQAGNILLVPKSKSDVIEECLNGGMANLDIPLKLFIMYIYHRKLFLMRDFEKFIDATNYFYALFPVPAYPIISGVYSIMRACVFSLLGEDEKAENSMSDAVDMLRPDEFIYPFSEYQMFYNRKLIRDLEKYWPECATRIDGNWDKYVYNRIRGHNRSTGRNLSTRLSKQETRTAMLAACGLSNKEIADRMEVAPGTIKTFLNNIYIKLDINDRKQIAENLYQPIDE